MVSLAKLPPDIPSGCNLVFQCSLRWYRQRVLARLYALSVAQADVHPSLLEHTRAPTPSQRAHCHEHLSANESHDTRYDSQRHHTIWRPDSVPEPAGGSIPPRGREHRSSAESQPGEISRLTISSRSVNAFQYSSRLLLTAYCLLLAVRCLLLASGFWLFAFRFSLFALKPGFVLLSPCSVLGAFPLTPVLILARNG